MPLNRFHLGTVTIEVNQSLVITTFPSGARLPAAPESGQSYIASAWRNGYEGDIERMNQRHDLGHSLIAFWLGLCQSPTLAMVAAGLPADGTLAALEEDAVQALERLANHLQVDLLGVAARWDTGGEAPAGPLIPGLIPAEAVRSMRDSNAFMRSALDEELSR